MRVMARARARRSPARTLSASPAAPASAAFVMPAYGPKQPRLASPPLLRRTAGGGDLLGELVHRGLLAGPHLAVDAAAHKQRLVTAALDHAASFQHQDLVGLHHGGEAVGDDQRRAVARDLAQRFLDLALGLGVERR